MKKLFPIIISISIFFTILIVSIFSSAYNKNFYITQFKLNNIYSNEMVKQRNISPEIIADEVIGYLKNDFSNLNRKGYFTNEEIIHMKDVKNLFLTSKYILILCILLILISTFMYIKKTKSIYSLLGKSIKYFIYTTIIIFLFLYFAFINFSESFIVFHKLLFSNDYWLLDESTSIIINIMPEDFFLAHAANVGKIFITLSVLFIVIILVILKFMKRNSKEDKYANI
ncbi:TIGR01906 family membrane protein [Clostridium cylindrosporum]|uniref:Integral membrane protein TIGR01906 n=1 Tax=Clostridium cylindrosporum DSM 605 TaxID=1121307 RepID=A0A0J8D437_CLOCY|nr:TIGR01906 family membrane protein [Clostridium cylindrosporum]KMT20940.1 hypothetical protein CLCY_1c01740 [Clostridium cylindrosporum DSM 605]